MSDYNKFVTAIFGDYSKKEVKKLQKNVDKINDLAGKYAAMDDKELAFLRTLDRPTIEQLRREIDRLDAAQKLTTPPTEDDEEEQEETEHRSRVSRRDRRQEKKEKRRRRKHGKDDEEEEEESGEDEEEEQTA